MRITLSAATTADGYLDDNTPRRLMISTPEDWADVCRLRTQCDAILVGAETLRRDNPALLLRDEAARLHRRTQGLRPDITKVTLTATGDLHPSMRFFTEGDADKIVFSPRPLPELEQVATVIVADAPLTPRYVVTELEKRGIGHLLVEGGAQILDSFIGEGVADELRLAVNPLMTLGSGRGGAHFVFSPLETVKREVVNLGGMEVTHYTLSPFDEKEDRHYLQMAVDESRHCVPSRTSYCVGAVIVTADGRIFKGYTHETSPTHHAEQEALKKALAAGAELRGATMYSSMEPCSKRSSEPESCSELMIRHGFARAVFALYEPDCFVCCRGALNLREAGIRVKVYPELAEGVRAVNAHLWK